MYLEHIIFTPPFSRRQLFRAIRRQVNLLPAHPKTPACTSHACVHTRVLAGVKQPVGRLVQHLLGVYSHTLEYIE